MLVIEGRDGFSQRCPLLSFVYGVGMVTLCKRIRDELRLEGNIVQPMYVDDYGSVANAIQNAMTMKCLQRWGPPFGYHPTSLKSKYVFKAREELLEDVQRARCTVRNTCPAGQKASPRTDKPLRRVTAQELVAGSQPAAEEDPKILCIGTSMFQHCCLCTE